MIRIIVVVTGLALAEANKDGGPIVLHFPKTDSFNVPALSLKDPTPAPLRMDKHQLMIGIGVEGGGDVILPDLPPFKLRLAASEGHPETKELALFFDLSQIAPGRRHEVREGCRWSDPLDQCEARGWDGDDYPLLAAQVQLDGPWEALAFESLTHKNRIPTPMAGNMASKVLKLIDDESLSTKKKGYKNNYPKWLPLSKRFGDTFLFQLELEDANDLAIELLDPGLKPASDQGPALGFKRFLSLAPSADYGSICSDVEECHVLWIDNSAPCRHNKHQPPCEPTSEHFKKLDIHLPHAFRILETYEPGTGLFVDDLFSVYGGRSESKKKDKNKAIYYDSSPRCYGGVVWN